MPSRYENETGRKPAPRHVRYLRTLGILIVIPLVLFGGSFTAESLLEARDARRYPAPGQLVDVGGYRLHVTVTGTRTGQPTVLLSHGSGSTADEWGWVVQQLSAVTQVVTFDRPGIGYSEAPSTPLRPDVWLSQLHVALTTVGVSGPYVVAGHDIGAVTSLAFAERYPDEVVGAVLVDPITTDNPAFVRKALRQEPLPPSPVLAQFARFGIFRLLDTNEQFVGQLPLAYGKRLRASMVAYHTNAGALPDIGLNDQLAVVEAPATALQDKPVVVLSAGVADQGFDAAARARFTALNTEVAKQRSRQGQHRVVAGVDHYGIVMSQAGATAVSAAIQQVFPR